MPVQFNMTSRHVIGFNREIKSAAVTHREPVSTSNVLHLTCNGKQQFKLRIKTLQLGRTLNISCPAHFSGARRHNVSYTSNCNKCGSGTQVLCFSVTVVYFQIPHKEEQEIEHLPVQTLHPLKESQLDGLENGNSGPLTGGVN